ncbi:hypothetical protein QQX98_002813 [Neonectria punicea]|uniref:Amidohydrolase-related domain-containing protein n=1 Tax=Neonectria punicea TaxID=979145 RepID=A0ABR1HGS4_9HYPO
MPGKYLFIGGYVATLDDSIGDFDQGAVLVEDGIIKAVGKAEDFSANTTNTEVIDTTDGVVIPGGHADAELQGLRDSGVRAFFCFGMGQDSYGEYPGGEAGWQARVSHVQKLRSTNTPDDLVQAGMSLSQPGTVPFNLTTKEIKFADEHGMLCCSHSCCVANTMICRDIEERKLHKLLLPGHVYIHCNSLSRSEIALIAKTGGKISIAPETEMQMGMGFPPLRYCIEHGLKPPLSIDTSSAVAPDLLSQMRLALQFQRSLDHDAVQESGGVPLEVEFTAHDALIWGTRNGAEAVGLGDKIGTLTPGKRADIVFISSKRALSSSAFPLTTAVLHSYPADVDTIMVDGHIRKRNGALVGQDLEAIRAKAKIGLQRTLKNLDTVPSEMTTPEVKEYIGFADRSTRANVAKAYANESPSSDWLKKN